MKNTNVKPIPEGYSTLTPYLVVKDAASAIDFYKRVLGAEELFRMDTPEGKVMHAELQIGNSRLMMTEESSEMGAVAPKPGAGNPVSLMIYVEDVDAWAKKATDAGMKTEMAVEDMFYGDRCGTFLDPFGHQWTIATHIEDVEFDEIKKRAEAKFGKAA